MFSLMESFPQSEGVESLIVYINEKSPALTKIILQQLFYDSFYRKFTLTIGNIFDFIFKKKILKIENLPFMH